ncbi:hypothetical protein TVAG_492740 [Trichomonas vaginalis G3]|uniref:Uncharacterized protein n=1 Tax=Trichomonas vaginalis (strain ATCC PRA-98 / G3) TaxID=412133 RepID=A2F8J0_TRIV3|nr:Ankyrin repeat family [Trichomonas vaginalis G3]EAX98783.1 hypothetical protein TVAG_492740 [Trichomonas vaginalis G3]KAI5483860.1 Ankyrin repeat family [Trichomonas vaginalis G3]|eukprot:XP_001311713.1 hypothetical protein [Trichomonas vaginalis G3]
MSTTSPQLTLFHYAALTLDVDVFMWCFQKVLFLKNEDGSISNTEDTDKYVLEFFESKKDFLMYCIKNSKDNPTEFVDQLLSNETFRSYSGYKGLILHRDKNNNNLLHYACMRASPILFLLITSEFASIIHNAPTDASIDFLSSKNNDGECPIHIAVKNKCMEILELASQYNAAIGTKNIFEDEPDNDIERVFKMSIELLSESCKNGSNNNDYEGIFQPDSKGQLILHIAVNVGWIEGVKRILEIVDNKSASFFVKYKDQHGLSPVAWMAINGHVKMLELVRSKFGEDVLFKDKTKYSRRNLLQLAITENQHEVVEYLINNTKFKENIDTSSGQPSLSALHYAVLLEDFEMIEYLVQNGCDPMKSKFNILSPYEMTTDEILRCAMCQ